MDDLEVLLREIEDLRNGLKANIEKGHYGEQYIEWGSCTTNRFLEGSYWGGNCNCHNIPQKVWIVDKSEPDIKKRSVSRESLNKIYNSSVWYTARYEAAKALGNQDLDVNIIQWISELTNLLDPSKSTDFVVQVMAVHDLGTLHHRHPNLKLKKLIKVVYKHNSNKNVRVQAGEELGYSLLRIGFHEMLR